MLSSPAEIAWSIPSSRFFVGRVLLVLALIAWAAIESRCRPSVLPSILTRKELPVMIARRFLILAPLLVVIIFALSACRYTTAASPAAPLLPGMSFSLTGDECPSLEISAGDRVTWTNQTSQPRQLTAQTLDGEILFDSGILKQGDIFAFIFPEAGTYSYTCWSEQDAPATITVQP